MSRYILIRRLRVPAFLLLIGVLALLHQMGAIGHFWHLFWPLAFILAGVILLAERAALASEEGYPPAPYPGSYPPPGPPYQNPPYQNPPYQAAPTTPAQPPAEPSTAIVPANRDYEIERNGGQS